MEGLNENRKMYKKNGDLTLAIGISVSNFSNRNC